MRTRRSIFVRLAACAALVALVAPADAQDIRPTREAMERPKSDYSPYPEVDFPNRVFWGDTHLHTSFDLGEADLSGDFVAAGYAKGVPMGGELASVSEAGAPTFLVAARKDPEGANLDRVQIVKGWLDAEGHAQEEIFDVIWSGERSPGADGALPPVGDTVDRETAEYTNTIGASELIAAFTDPGFDPSRKAFYYVRVLEIPTPRWTLYDEVRFGIEMDDAAPLVHQERAFISPIWYAP